MRIRKYRAWNGKEMLFASMDDILDGYKPSDFRVESQESEIFEIMDCTGLKDKNGKEIYEFDLIKCNDRFHKDEVYEVEFIDGGYYYPFADDDDGLPYPHPKECEIIGNNFETPELMK